MAFPTGSTSSTITIDNTKVSGSSNLTNFPVLISDSNIPSTVYAGMQTGEISAGFLSADANLQGYYKVESGALTTDSSGNSNTLTNNNSVAETTGVFGGGADLGDQSGSKKSLSRTDGLGIDLSGSWTMGLRFSVNVAPTSSEQQYLIDIRSTTGTGRYVLVKYRDNAGTKQLEVNAGGTVITHNVDLGTDTYNTYSVRNSSGTVTLWLNGLQVASGSMGSTANATNKTTIGTATDGATSPAKVKFDEVIFLNRALSDAEIKHVHNGGADIRFTSDSAGTTEIPFEIVSLNAGAETAEIWVKVPTVSYNTDTEFYIWYGDAALSPYAVGDTYGRNAVWSDYRAVYHLGEATNTSRVDATGNGFTLSESTSDDIGQAAGKIGNAADFELTDAEYLNNASTTILSNQPTNATIQAWIRPESQPSESTMSAVSIVTSPSGSTGFLGVLRYRETGGQTYFTSGWQGTTGGSLADNAETVSNGSDAFLALTKTGSTIQPYFNGAAEASTGTLGTAGDWSTHSTGINLGVSRTQNSSPFDGLIDEVRVRESALSADWLATEYANQNAPGTFLTIATGAASGFFAMF